ncbi:hypothetical protein BayCH28_01550 [Mycolicibacterium sp. CH28]|uniref:hypothetical protein n=1 Tax=Mycolicibacterium sp. CH28 TaxID=2512237 RepID=UPI001080FE37|nr:hypothetical protein [Mycolicibacterium sp. CH28]TGD90573.1 hypothetical protein BayCH28_01550 [Mycolicibacterium sp. CH28]
MDKVLIGACPAGACWHSATAVGVHDYLVGGVLSCIQSEWLMFHARAELERLSKNGIPIRAASMALLDFGIPTGGSPLANGSQGAVAESGPVSATQVGMLDI